MSFHPPALRRALTALALLFALTPLWAQAPATAAAPKTPSDAPAACPPVATAPTPQQLQAARAQARDRGALWRLERDGRVSWLYGTLHLGRLEWAVPGPRVTRALLSVDAVALEVDVSDPALVTQMKQIASPPAPAALQARLAKQAVAACVPVDALAGFPPLLQVLTLSGLDARWIGLDPAYGIEHVLGGFAKSRQLPLIALETAAMQLQALVPTQPDEAEQALETTLSQLESGLSRRVMARLGQAWADGDLETVASYEAWCECVAGEADRAALRRLNDARNPPMANRITTLHVGGQRLFAAVGLLHMTGPQALPQLLAERGFKVERIALLPP